MRNLIKVLIIAENREVMVYKHRERMCYVEFSGTHNEFKPNELRII
jgi:hypothetical protein